MIMLNISVKTGIRFINMLALAAGMRLMLNPYSEYAPTDTPRPRYTMLAHARAVAPACGMPIPGKNKVGKKKTTPAQA